MNVLNSQRTMSSDISEIMKRRELEEFMVSAVEAMTMAVRQNGREFSCSICVELEDNFDEFCRTFRSTWLTSLKHVV